MKNKNQYNQSDLEGQVPVTAPKQVLTRTPTDIKLQQLEEQVSAYQKEVAKLRRDISRLKNAIGDLERVVKNRG